MGGFEPEAKPWNVDPIPDGFEFQLLPEDWDQFEILMTNAIHRTPCLETAQVKMLLNGPESFTLDGNFILGEAPEVARLLRLRRLQLGRHRQLRRRRQARRRVDRRRRGAARPVGRRHPPLRAVPRQSPASRRPHRRVARPALRDALAARGARRRCGRCAARRSTTGCAAKGAVFGTKMNWERANYFLPPGAPPPPYTLGTPGWLPHVLDEQRACREDVVVFDQTSFSQVRAQGPRRARRAAAAVRQRDRRAGRPDGLHGDAQRARRLRERSHDHRASRRDKFFILTGSAQTTRDFAWIERAHRRRRARGAGRRDQRVLGDLADGTEGRGAARARCRRTTCRRPACRSRRRGDRRRLRARARGADELRRRPRLRALRRRPTSA